MKEKTKEFLKKYLIGFILGIISACTVSVIAATYFPSNDVTYDNSTSGLSSTDVQGAIDELYGVCTAEPSAGEIIIEEAGLEKDPYECRYFFTGADPNNYITFNNETAGWRIISVECDGTIKIMRTVNIDRQYWDSSNSNNWARPATLNTYLNETYYNGLNSTAKGQIVAKDWSIGGVTDDNYNLATQITSENATKWNGKIALVTVSEYIRSNSNKNSCGNIALLNTNAATCKRTTWLHNNIDDYWWLLTPSATYDVIYYIRSHSERNGDIYDEWSSGYSQLIVRPVLYLSSNLKVSGKGTRNNPYIFE